MKEARHPLIDPDAVVANTYEMREGTRCLLISGSNTGGKTVTLKTLALFVTMDACGISILCEQAPYHFLNKIYLDIGDKQSIQESLSTFSGHLARLSLICERADAHSFVVLDELGSGTDPNEGECLAIAILEALLQQQATIIASTHFAKSSLSHDTRGYFVSSVTFDMETMMPTYHYVEGVSGQSNALRSPTLSFAGCDRRARTFIGKSRGKVIHSACLSVWKKKQLLCNREKMTLHARLDECRSCADNCRKRRIRCRSTRENCWKRQGRSKNAL